MLFRFGFFWLILFVLISSWVVYVLWGFEFTIVTLVALIVAILINNYLGLYGQDKYTPSYKEKK